MVVLILVREWQAAVCNYRLQQSTTVVQLLLEQATSGLCTLSLDSGLVSEASSAFLESFGMIAEGANMFEFVDPAACGKPRHRDCATAQQDGG